MTDFNLVNPCLGNSQTNARHHQKWGIEAPSLPSLPIGNIKNRVRCLRESKAFVIAAGLSADAQVQLKQQRHPMTRIDKVRVWTARIESRKCPDLQ